MTNKKVRVPADVCREIVRRARLGGFTQAELCKIFNLPRSVIRRVLRNEGEEDLVE